MTDINFTSEEKTMLVDKIQRYFREELDTDIGQFDAEFLLDFLSAEVGVYYYNRGLFDAQAILEKRLDSLTGAIAEMEKATDFTK